MSEKLYSIRKASDFLGTTYKTTLKYIHNGDIKSIQIGDTINAQRVIYESELIKFKASHENVIKHSIYSKGINKRK